MDIPITTNPVKLFSFPLNIAIIDDEADFLNMVAQEVNNPNATLHNYADAALKQLAPIKINLMHFMSNDCYDVNYNNIKQFVETCKDKQGILISDYKMPEINGIELLDKFKNDQVIKILLTNVRTADESIQAFQDESIDAYLPKKKLGDISQTISELQDRYFTKITNNILSLLQVKDYQYLLHDDYQKIFNTVCQQLNIEKYYILNGDGHYFLQSGQQKYILTIYTEAELEAILPDMPANKQDDVFAGALIPSHFFSPDNQTLLPARQVGTYCYAIEKIAD